MIGAGRATRLGEFLDHIVRAERPMRRQQRLQHLAADRREALAALLADRLRMRDRVRGAAGVVVIRIMKDGGCGCFIGISICSAVHVIPAH